MNKEVKEEIQAGPPKKKDEIPRWLQASIVLGIFGLFDLGMVMTTWQSVTQTNYQASLTPQERQQIAEQKQLQEQQDKLQEQQNKLEQQKQAEENSRIWIQVLSNPVFMMFAGMIFGYVLGKFSGRGYL